MGGAAAPARLVLGALFGLLLTRVAAARPLPHGARAAGRKEPQQRTFQVHIGHVNDVHNRIEQTTKGGVSPCSADEDAAGTCFGGYGRLSTAAGQLRAQAGQEGAAFYFLNAGDEFMGSLWDVVYKGYATSVLQRQLASLRPDAQTLGNHEFDYGPARAAQYIRNVTHPFVVCNIDTSKEPSWDGVRTQPWMLLKHPALKIAVVGWTTPTTAEVSSPGSLIRFKKVVPSVRSAIADLKKQHADVDLIIGLSHAGYDVDQATAAAVPELDLIVGGHTHSFLANNGSAPVTDTASKATDTAVGPYPTWVNTTTASGAAKRVPIVQVYYASKYMGLVKLTVQRGRGVVGLSGAPVLLGAAASSNSVAQDPAVARIIAHLKPAVEALNSEVVGRTNVALDGDFEQSRTRETNLGDYICDALLRSVAQLPLAAQRGAPTICLLNSGQIRQSLPIGPLTRGDVIATLPFGNTLTVIDLRGSDLLEALEHGASGFPASGSFLQLSGLRLLHTNGTFRSASLLSNGTEAAIDPARSYSTVTVDYMRNGGDGFSSLKAAQVLYPGGEPIDQLVARDLQQHPLGIAPQVEGRIVNCQAVACQTPSSLRSWERACCSAAAAAA